MKRYNMIKNLMIASATAVLYWGEVIENVGIVPKVFGTVAIFALMLILLRDGDKHYLRETPRE